MKKVSVKQVLLISVLLIVTVLLIGHFSNWPLLSSNKEFPSEAEIEKLLTEGYAKLLQLAEKSDTKHLHGLQQVSTDGSYNLYLNLYQTGECVMLEMHWHNEKYPLNSDNEPQKDMMSEEKLVVLRDFNRDCEPEDFKEYEGSELNQTDDLPPKKYVPLKGKEDLAGYNVLFGLGIQFLIDQHLPNSKYTSESVIGF